MSEVKMTLAFRDHSIHVVMAGILPAVLSIASSAIAFDTQQCVSAYEQAQILRKETKFRAAREQLLLCSQSVCPAFMVNDCGDWLSDIDVNMPTIVLSASDGQGRAMTTVRVKVDGAPFASALDGKAVPLDPGLHRFQFESDNGASAEQEHMILQGERNRRITVDLRDPRERTPTHAKAEAPAASDAKSSASKAALGVVLEVVGLAGVGSFVYLGMKGRAEVEHMRTGCAPNCRQEDVDAAQTKLVAADVALGVGIASLGIGTWLLLSSQKAGVRRRTAELEVRPIAHGGTAQLAVEF